MSDHKGYAAVRANQTLLPWLLASALMRVLHLELEDAVELVDAKRRTFIRCAAMLAGGALEEVVRLAARGLDSGLPVMRALGVPQLLQHIRGETGLEAAVAAAKMETRRYIKRQMSWMKRNMISWKYNSET